MDTLEQNDEADQNQQPTTQEECSLTLSELCARGVVLRVEPAKPNLRAIERAIRNAIDEADLNLGVAAENIGGRSEVVVFPLDVTSSPDPDVVRAMVRSAFGAGCGDGAKQSPGRLSEGARASLANALLSKGNGKEKGKPTKHALMLDGQKLLEGRKQSRKTTSIVGEQGWIDGNICGVALKSSTLVIEEGSKRTKIGFEHAALKESQRQELDKLLLPCSNRKVRVPIVLRADGTQYVPGEALLGVLRATEHTAWP